MNMVNSESWLDSSQLRSSAISHAKCLNYLPASAKSSQAIINLTIPTDGLINVISIPKGTSFAGRAGINSFNFSLPQTTILTSLTGVFTLNNVTIYEGIFLSDVYVVDNSQENQQFLISNLNVDISSITVVVSTNSGATTLEYTYELSLLGLLPNSLSYFLQCNETEQYQVIFGNNLFGLEPPNGAIVTISYRVASGDVADGVQTFTINSDVTGGHLQGSCNVATVQASMGGASPESIASIQFNAPRHYATQERAVATSDYEVLMTSNFPEVIACAAFGGETQNPKIYGSVYISVVLANVLGLPQSKQIEYYNFIRPRSAMAPIFITPQTIYYNVVSTINYNVNVTTLQPADIQTIVIAAIVNYNSLNFDDFNVIFRESPFSTMIDDAHPSIISDETDIYLYVKLQPVVLIAQNLTIQFGVPIFANYPPVPLAHGIDEVHAVWSDPFTYNNQTVILEDDSQGNLRIVRSQGNSDYVVQNIGTVNYATGQVQITNILIQQYNQFINLYMKPATKDFSINGNSILNLDPNFINLTVNAIQE